MREYLLGALGAALAYPAIWYQMAPEPVALPVVAHAPEPVVAVSELGRRQTTRESVRRAVESLEAPVAAAEAPAHVPIGSPKEPRVAPPRMPVTPLPAALPETIRQMSELQRLAGDPMRLAEHVQGLESNAAELAELKAFAEKFVTLPPDRVDERIMNPSGRAGPRHPAPARR